MLALRHLLLLYIIIYIFWGFKDVKNFLLFTGIFTLPFRTTYSLYTVGPRTGWTSGIVISASEVSLLMLFLYLLIFRKSEGNSDKSSIKPIVLFIFACILSMINTVSKPLTALQVIMMAQTFLLYFITVTLYIESEEDVKNIIAFITVTALFQSIIGITQHITGKEMDYFKTGHAIFSEFQRIDSIAGSNRVYGTVGNPNGYASFLVSVLIINVSLYIGGRNNNIQNISILFIISTALLLSFSRGAWISFSLGFLFILFYFFIKDIMKNTTVFGLIVIISVLFILFYQDIYARFSGDDHNAAYSRIPLLKLAWNMFKEHPLFGIGANTFTNVKLLYVSEDIRGIWLDQVHNHYLLILAEMGIVGLIFFMMIIVKYYKNCFSILSNNFQKDNMYMFFLGVGLLASIIAMNVHMVVDIYNSRLLLGTLFIFYAITSKKLQDNVIKQLEWYEKIP